MSLGDKNGFGALNEEGIKVAHRMFPNLQALSAETVYTVYREFIPRRDEIEYTLFYREPDGDKYRVDAVVDCKQVMFVREEDIDHTIVRITKWGKATEAIT